MPTYFTDRSRTETYQKCPRLRYLTYEYSGRGMVPNSLSLPLMVGTAVHAGIQLLLKGQALKDALQSALDPYWQQVRQRELALGASEDQYLVAHEQAALIEALLRGWAKCRLERLRAEYEILDVEREEIFDLGRGISWMSRADAVLRHKSTNEITIYSVKTCSQWDSRQADEHEIDMQGNSELPAVEERLGERVASVQMDYLIKGRRYESPRGSGVRRQGSPLVRGWRQSGVTPDRDRYAWTYDWATEDGRRKRLTKDGGGSWEPYFPWEEGQMGLKGWLDLLSSGETVPPGEDVLAAQFITPPPHYRSPDAIAEWQVSTRAQEEVVRESAQRTEEARQQGPEAYALALATYFPKNPKACNFYYGGRCPFHHRDADICWTGLGITEQNPVDTGAFRWREPHHMPEKERQARS